MEFVQHIWILPWQESISCRHTDKITNSFEIMLLENDSPGRGMAVKPAYSDRPGKPSKANSNRNKYMLSTEAVDNPVDELL